MKSTIFVLISIALLSCAMVNKKSVNDQESSVKPQKNNVTIQVTHFTPYCGGAAPTYKVLEHQTQPQQNTDFLLINLYKGDSTIVRSDKDGVIKLNLERGNYILREFYKVCTFEEFQRNNSAPNGQYFLPSADMNCYEQWWKSNLAEFKIQSIDSNYTLQFGTTSRCFTGNNPCIMYNGPMPP